MFTVVWQIFVMPAKAGIQNLLILSERIGSAYGGNDFYWIPASAGMTIC